MFHAFNGGFYDNTTKSFKLSFKDPPDKEIEYPLGAELWAYVPFNVLPHLHWLTDPDYRHVYFVDLQPMVVDVKLWPETGDPVHVNGWGTVLVGGMRFGGGLIKTDVDRDGTFDNAADREMRSAYFILDITDPESPPTVLGEIAIQGMGYTTCFPAVMPFRDKSGATFNANRWYLVFGNGPADSNGDPVKEALLSGSSQQRSKIYVLDLTELTDTTPEACLLDSSGICTSNSAFTFATTSGEGTPTYYDDFVSQMVSLDWNLDYDTDALYYGTVRTYFSNRATWAVNSYGGSLERLVALNEPLVVDWTGVRTLISLSKTSIFADTGWLNAPTGGSPYGQPVVAAPSMGMDKDGRRWAYFGTGRFYSLDDSTNDDYMSFYGIKEPIDGSKAKTDPDYWTWGTVVRSSTSSLLNVSEAVVLESKLVVNLEYPVGTDITHFDDVLTTVKSLNGWYLDFRNDSGAYVGANTAEKNLGQAVLFGDIVTWTTYIPSADLCEGEGETHLYAADYRTGTAFYKSVIGLNTALEDPAPGDDKFKVVRRTGLGKGLSTTPNIHSGQEAGTKAFIQTSTGAIIVLEEANPGITKSGKISWREEGEE
jgi:type IV pilus assembly protein PilY1